MSYAVLPYSPQNRPQGIRADDRVVKSLGNKQEVLGSHPGAAEDVGHDGIICKYLRL